MVTVKPGIDSCSEQRGSGCPFAGLAATFRVALPDESVAVSTSFQTSKENPFSLPSAPCPRQTRRQLRRLNQEWDLKDVRNHRYKDDGWIVVNGKVYDITEHVLTHPGWEGAGISTVLSILAHLGTDCSEEFEQIHRPFPIAWKQLAAYYIGDVCCQPRVANGA